MGNSYLTSYGDFYPDFSVADTSGRVRAKVSWVVRDGYRSPLGTWLYRTNEFKYEDLLCNPEIHPEDITGEGTFEL